MTLLSFVVPVHRVQGYLRECLDSLLGQEFDDVEVIAVDDCSPDASPEILTGYAGRDPRVRLVRLGGNVGLGPARNVGLDRATGEYVWFVDGDDWLTPGCLPAIAERLRTTRPDVLLVDHVRVHWNDRVTRSALRDVLPEPIGPQTFRLVDRPEVVRLLHTAWNKIVRREFLRRLDLRFAPGWYEDVPFSYPVLLAAERISLLDRVCVNYRQRRTGAITRTPSRRHLDVFAQWERVFRFLAEHPAAAGSRQLHPVLFDRMIWHYLTVLGNGDRIPAELRPAFFARIVADYDRWRPPEGHRPPGGIDGIKHRLVAAGRWRTFTALRDAHRAGDAVRRGVRTARRRAAPVLRGAARQARDAALHAGYRAELRRPVDPNLAVYAAYWYRGYACNPAAIHAAARRLAPHVRGVWIVRRDRVDTLPPGLEYVVAGTPAYYRVLARARWLINNVNFPDDVRKRPCTMHVQTHHGTPVKVMGLDQRRYPLGAPGMDFAALLRRIDRWDYSISSNSYSTQMWERAYPAAYTTLEVGYPRNDRLVTATPDEIAELRTRLGITPDQRVVLYLPTHREHLPDYRPPFEPGPLLDVLGPTGRLLVRSHYFHDRRSPGHASRQPPGSSGGWPPGSSRLWSSGCPDRRRHPDASEWATDDPRVTDVTAYDPVEDLYLAADVLVTDYSSAMFDYAVLDRPIVVYAPDLAAYRLIRGIYLDVTQDPPGAVATTFPELLDVFATGAVDSADATAHRQRFRARFCVWDDGHAAERVVQRIFLNDSGQSTRMSRHQTW